MLQHFSFLTLQIGTRVHYIISVSHLDLFYVIIFVVFFNQELELLPTREIQENIYIKHPVSIEQYLMEGSYNKVSVCMISTSFISLRIICARNVKHA